MAHSLGAAVGRGARTEADLDPPARAILAGILMVDRDVYGIGNGWAAHLPVGRPLHEVEDAFILETLKAMGGNRARAATALRLSLRGLRNRLAALKAAGVSVPAPPPPVKKGA